MRPLRLLRPAIQSALCTCQSDPAAGPHSAPHLAAAARLLAPTQPVMHSFLRAQDPESADKIMAVKATLKVNLLRASGAEGTAPMTRYVPIPLTSKQLGTYLRRRLPC